MYEFYERAEVDAKQKLLSSIFPEKLTFDGEKCRTPRVNEVLRLTLLNDNSENILENNHSSQFLHVSALVVPRGIEPRCQASEACVLSIVLRDQAVQS